VFDNTPAALEGTLAAGDEITGVNGKAVKGKTKVEVAKMIQAVTVRSRQPITGPGCTVTQPVANHRPQLYWYAAGSQSQAPAVQLRSQQPITGPSCTGTQPAANHRPQLYRYAAGSRSQAPAVQVQSWQPITGWENIFGWESPVLVN